MPSSPAPSKDKKAARKEQKEESRKVPQKLGGSGRVPRSDPEFDKLDVPTITTAVVKIQNGTLVLRCTEIKGAEQYEWETRRGEGWPIDGHRATKKPQTELTKYPLGPEGVPQVRVRAVGDEALSLYTPWLPSKHDLGVRD